jgi:hypothetical protein
MPRTQEQKLGFWFGNFLILCSLALILWQYYNLYIYGHLQCRKSEFENDTIDYANWGYIILLFVLFFKSISLLKVEFSDNAIIGILCSFLFVMSILLSVFMNKYFVGLIINKVNDRIENKINLDGQKNKGVVSFDYYTTRSWKGNRTDYYYVRFKYLSGRDSVSSCYSFGMQPQQYKAGDTISFLISKSNPEYIKISE